MNRRFDSPYDIALWLFSIIAPLLHRSNCALSRRAELIALSQKTFLSPEGIEKQLSPDTLRNWLYRYKAHGIDGLLDKVRKDSGRTTVPPALAEALASLRDDNPELNIKRLLQKLLEQGAWDGRSPSRSALYRYAADHNLGRNQSTTTPQSVKPFEFPDFGDLWSSDFLHGPKVRMGTHAHKSYLHAIIDDSTRYIVAAHFYLEENTRSVLTDLMLATRRFGVPKRFYTDNGPAFRSTHLRMAAARLAISLPHTPPYDPQGRGKIERFFRTVREDFLAGKEKTTQKKLNADFAYWLNTYHHRTHHSLGISPLDRKLSDQGQELRQLPPNQDLAENFRMEVKKRVYSDGCVRLLRKRFEIPNALPGQYVNVYYLPWEDDHILVGPERIVAREPNLVKNAHRFEKPVRRNHNKKDDQA